MKRFFTILLIALFAINVSAETFEVDGINYNTTSANTVCVFPKTPKYSGNIVIPSTVTYNNITYSVTLIGFMVFYECTDLTSITIPNSVTEIGYYAFRYCSSLTSVTIGNSVTEIGYYAFADCSSLTSITIPNSVTEIGDYAFLYCTDLTSVSIGNSVTKIGDYTFLYCTDLTSVSIGNSITKIGDGAFGDCSSLTSITIPNSVTSIGYGAFEDCINLTSITIPNSVTSIGYAAFYYCKSLTSITIPNSVTSIGKGTFGNCSSLNSVNIGNSVTEIERAAFDDCTALTSITCHAIVPPSLGIDVFYNVPKNIPLYVPAGSVNAYKVADQWKDFYKMWIVGIESPLSIVNTPSSINIYPNPTESDLHIDINGSDESNINFELINLQGQTISNGNFDGNTILQTKELEAGVYFIKFTNEHQTIDILKFIKK